MKKLLEIFDTLKDKRVFILIVLPWILAIIASIVAIYYSRKKPPVIYRTTTIHVVQVVELRDNGTLAEIYCDTIVSIK